MKHFLMSSLVAGVVFAGVVAAPGVGVAAAAEPAKPSANLYISYAHQDIIDIMDPATHKILRTVKGIPDPHGMRFSPDGKHFYAASESENEPEEVLGIVDQTTGKVIKMIHLSGVAHGSMTLSKDGKRLFVPIKSLPGGLDVIDTTTLEKVKTISMKSGLHDTQLTPDGKYIVAGSVEGKFLTVVDVKTEQPVWEMNFDTGLQTIAVEEGPDGSTRRLFIMREFYHGIDVVDFAKRQVVSKIAIPETDRFKSNKHPKVETSPAHGIDISPDKKTLWANSRWGDAVFVYSLPDLKLMGHVSVGKGPGWMAFSPDSKTVYNGNAEEQSLSVIDTKTLKEVDRIELKSSPRKFFSGPALP